MSHNPVEAAPVFTLDHIRQLADGQSFSRGAEYFREGRVGSIVEHKGAIKATVSGSERYHVSLRIDGEEITAHCSCPRGDFCKHCVAVSLAWLEAAAPKNPKKKASPGVVKLADLRPWLLQQSPETLAELILDAASSDRRLRERLLRQAAQATNKGTDIASYRRAIDAATTPDDDRWEYGDVTEFFEGIAEAVDSLRKLLDEGFAAEALELSEYAIERVEGLACEFDESNDESSAILENLGDLHFDAAEKVKPEPVAFAERLFAREFAGESLPFSGACKTYAPLLGSAGLARYRALAEAEWARIPALEPGSYSEFSTARVCLKYILEHFATGDLDALIAVKSRDLSQAHTFLEIARLCMDAGRRDEGLAWVERGHRAFPTHRREDFTTFLAEEYHRRQRHDEALALIWVDFQAHPSLAACRRLKENAERVTPRGTWPEWRERALALLRKLLTEKPVRKNAHLSRHSIDASLLVEIFLWENDLETAWQTAHASGCSNDLWFKLADAREATHPADVLPIHQRAAENHIAQKHKGAYIEAVQHLTKMRALYRRLDRDADWLAYLTRLRTEHQRLRSFLTLAAEL